MQFFVISSGALKYRFQPSSGVITTVSTSSPAASTGGLNPVSISILLPVCWHLYPLLNLSIGYQPFSTKITFIFSLITKSTSSSIAPENISNGHRANVGAIAGGVVGAVVFILTALLAYSTYQRRHQKDVQFKLETISNHEGIASGTSYMTPSSCNSA